MTVIDKWIEREYASQNQAIEVMCERMLVTPGTWGVLVETWTDGWSVSLSDQVAPMKITYQQRMGRKPRDLEPGS